MDSKTIGEYLAHIQWEYMTVDPATVITGYRCLVPFYDFQILIEIKASPHWVSIRGLLQRGIKPARRGGIAAFLSTLNAQSRAVRFFLVEDCAVVQSEVPTSRFHPGTFAEALKSVCRYASTFGLEVSVLATNPSVAGLYSQIEAALEPGFQADSARNEDMLAEFNISANRLAD